ncbi:hypothetical protein BDF14DRAFT_1885178 [Spinellus fusiger]|nr:hypothetical protein BDF14DRAFT_1885178 [Spinellus fusiger]
MPSLELELRPDTNVIDLLGSSAPMVVQGTVELRLLIPVYVLNISVELNGFVHSMTSNESFNDQSKGLLILADSPHQLPCVHRIARKALCKIKGFKEFTQVLAHHRIVVLQSSQPCLMEPGVYTWPFEFTVEDSHLLPPTLSLPHHAVRYWLSANLTPGSLQERLKISYNNVHQRMTQRAAVAYRRLSHSSSLSEEDGLPDSPSPHYTPLPPTHHEHHLLSTSQSLCVRQYIYTSYHALTQAPRTRYRGVRQGSLRYEICLPGNAYVGRKEYNFHCEFYPLRPDLVVDEITACVEQIESYSLQEGQVVSEHALTEQNKVLHTQRYSHTLYKVKPSDRQSHIALFVPLNTPLVYQHVASTALQIQHQLRLVIRFCASVHERKMTLSFPLLIGTFPMSGLYCTRLHQHTLLASNEMDDADWLPSYSDALSEGTPPCEFYDDI